MTKYKVLIQNPEGGYDVIAEEVEYHGPLQAMRKVGDTLAPEVVAGGVTLVAVPVTNWTEEAWGLATPPPRLVMGGEQTTIEGAVAEVEAEAPEPEVES